MARNAQVQKTEALESFAARLRAAMARREVTLQDIAKACGVAVSTVGAWTQAKNWPQVELQLCLAKHLDVSVSFLIHGITEYAESADKIPVKVEEARAALPGLAQKKSELVRRPGSPLALHGDDPAHKRRMELATKFGGVQDPTRAQCLAYLDDYLEAASHVPGGIGHAWIELQKCLSKEDLREIKEPE